MKIGLISKPDHCKSHIKALSSEGFDVVGLGGDVSSIPPTVDVLVVRTQSCSHGATDTALAWFRSTSKPLIVHNGLSSIRRELRRIVPMEASPTVDFSKALKVLKRDRPNDPSSLYWEALVAMGATDQDLAEILPQEPRVETPPSSPEPSLGDWGRDFPKTDPGPVEWLKGLPLSRLAREFEETKKIYNETPEYDREHILEAFTEALEKGLDAGFFKGVQDNPTLASLRGRPTRFCLFFLRLLPGGLQITKAILNDAYRDLTGKNTNVQMMDGTAWALGRTMEVGKPFVRRAKDETTPPQASSETSSESELLVCVPDQPEETSLEEKLKSLREENEEYILELMNSVTELKAENKLLHGAISELRSKLEEAVGELRQKLTETPRAEKDSILDALDTLKKRGAKITIEI